MNYKLKFKVIDDKYRCYIYIYPKEALFLPCLIVEKELRKLNKLFGVQFQEANFKLRNSRPSYSMFSSVAFSTHMVCVMCAMLVKLRFSIQSKKCRIRLLYLLGDCISYSVEGRENQAVQFHFHSICIRMFHIIRIWFDKNVYIFTTHAHSAAIQAVEFKHIMLLTECRTNLPPSFQSH